MPDHFSCIDNKPMMELSETSITSAESKEISLTRILENTNKSPILNFAFRRKSTVKNT